MAAILNQARLRQYLDLNYNVLFKGQHGVGKTAIITQVFDDAGLKWKYFSASTLDPWVDFVGVPKVMEGPNGPTLELIRPGYIQADDIEALFFDELNRAPDKVLNAVMELIQFKSINGFKLNNLKVIWAAINPEDDDDTYSVNHLDPAQIDRFHVHLDVPFKVDESWFRKRYPENGQIFIDWWKDPQMSEEIRQQISPRRLDYAAHAYANNCRLEDFLPAKANIKTLRTLLMSTSYHEKLRAIKSEAEASVFLKDINNSTKLLEMAKSADSSSLDFFHKYAALVPKELVETVAEFVHAYKNGATVVKSLSDMIKQIPTASAQGAASFINNVDIKLLFKTREELSNDLRALNASDRLLIVKLANSISDALTKMSAKGLAPTTTGPGTISNVERILWGATGKSSQKPTNLQVFAMHLTKMDNSLFANSRRAINKRLYENKIMTDMNWL